MSEEEEEAAAKWLQCDRCGRWREFKEGSLQEAEEVAGYWECGDGQRTCSEPCDHCGREHDCACRDTEPQEEGWVTVGQRVPPYFSAETKYRRGSCMPWLCYRAYCPACRRQSGNLDRRSKMDNWLAVHRRCVPAWESLTTEGFSWRLDGLAREVAKSAKAINAGRRQLSHMEAEDRWSSEDSGDEAQRPSKRRVGGGRGGSGWWAAAGGASDASSDGGALCETPGSGDAQRGSGAECKPGEWEWTPERIVQAVEARICWLLQHRFSHADCAALGRRPWPEVQSELQDMVISLPPDSWPNRLQELVLASC